jgi:hypothetical protein
MNVPLTFACFAVLTAALVLLRFRWHSLPARVRSVILVFAFIFPAVLLIAAIRQWCTPSLRFNSALYWICIASYELLLILFTRLRPRWLTTLIAIVLILPLLSASVFIPLTLLFNAPPITTASIGDHIITQRTTWGSGSVQTSGTDLAVYYQPAWAPFLLRRMRSTRYFGGQCNAWAAYVVLEPDHTSALWVCPAYPNQPSQTAHSIVLPLP